MKVCVAVRKRPINERERAMRDYDAVTAMNPRVAVHSCKLKVDGITKYLENQLFEFDHVSWPLVAFCRCFHDAQGSGHRTISKVLGMRKIMMLSADVWRG